LTFEEIENYHHFAVNFAHASFLPHATCVEMIKDLENIKAIWQGLQNHSILYGEDLSKKIITGLTILTVFPSIF
jgi:4-hydroxybenzoate polyprenyltransferase